MDRAILGHDFEKQRLLQEVRKDTSDASSSKKVSHIKEILSFAGSTAVVMIVFRETSHLKMEKDNSCEAEGPVKLVLANVGDCRAVISDAGLAVPLTNPHKPSIPSEKLRIEKAGGWVHRNRVNGVLAVSRSFGDIMYKTFPPNRNVDEDILVGEDDGFSWSEGGGLWGSKQQVISKPEIVEYEVKSTHEFVVLASDGVWDVMSPEEVINFVRLRLAEHGDCQRAAIETVSKAEGRGTSDNTSVIICCLNQIERTADFVTKRLSHSVLKPNNLNSPNRKNDDDDDDEYNDVLLEL
jgi:serine/threonine protein phosphatase PrpC